MAYEGYFTSKFRQSDMIGVVLKKADLENKKKGACSTMTMLWIINSLRMGGSPARSPVSSIWTNNASELK
jgi:hypothetical protein